ncbi:hypothetical protein Pth03_18230 [Planotetraspora thailandica]|uniref:Transcription termination factor Rho n=1 Tax=Planotetraspora thailandica TaxID=487172 RepID=A0A8J3XUM6_9ACTN|nr:hypothetical protein Pth03_18230 [Planotetraspora thailandica]
MTTPSTIPRSRPPGSRRSGRTAKQTPETTPISGLVAASAKNMFVRAGGYLPGPKDVAVPPALVHDHGLRPGDVVRGTAQNGRLIAVTDVNGRPPGEERPDFADLIPIHPTERLRLETVPGVVSTRVIDLLAPIGKGQRGLIVAPPKAGKTVLLQAIANAVTANHPECHLMIVLVDERPEEVTEMREAVQAEVVASTFDRPVADHIAVTELAIERAKRLVELGHDVVVLIDSITRLGRAYNMAAPNGGRILTGGIDVRAVHPPKRVLGAARNIKDGGSLTILATALVETGSKMDDNLFEEFKSTGNMELRLSRSLSEKRVFPAVDVAASGTRRDELLLDPAELALVWKLRKALHGQDTFEPFLAAMRNTGSNAELLVSLQNA